MIDRWFVCPAAWLLITTRRGRLQSRRFFGVFCSHVKASWASGEERAIKGVAGTIRHSDAALTALVGAKRTLLALQVDNRIVIKSSAWRGELCLQIALWQPDLGMTNYPAHPQTLLNQHIIFSGMLVIDLQSWFVLNRILETALINEADACVRRRVCS